MATVQETVYTSSGPVSPGGGPRTYPWAEWLDGRTYTIAMGEDFDSEPSNFRPYLYAQAQRRGLKMRACKIAGEDKLQFAAYAPDARKPVLPDAPHPAGRPSLQDTYGESAALSEARKHAVPCAVCAQPLPPALTAEGHDRHRRCDSTGGQGR